jgi:hypothetical protein
VLLRIVASAHAQETQLRVAAAGYFFRPLGSILLDLMDKINLEIY